MSTVEGLEKEVKTLQDRVSELEGAYRKQSEADAAKALLSGQIPRRHIHLSQEIGHWDRYALVGTIAVWTLFLRNNPSDWSVAWASGLSSILVGVWRFYARYLDDAIAETYPSIAHYESALQVMPDNSVLKKLMKKGLTSDSIREIVQAKLAGDRGHLPFDWLGLMLIPLMGIATVYSGDWGRLTCCGWLPLHSYSLLLFNLVGVVLVLWAMNGFQTRKGGMWGVWTRWHKYRSTRQR